MNQNSNGQSRNESRTMPLDYIKESLSPNEKIIHAARFHWFYDVVSWGWLVLGLVLGIGVLVGGTMYNLHLDLAKAFPNIEAHLKPAAEQRLLAHYGGWIGLVRDLHLALKLLSLFCVLWGVVIFFSRMIIKYTTEIAITNQRLVFKRGVIARYVGEMKMDRIEGINVWQSFFGRIFNYGRIVVHGIGIGQVALPEIEDPIKFRKAIDYARTKLNEDDFERSRFDRLQNPVDNRN